MLLTFSVDNKLGCILSYVHFIALFIVHMFDKFTVNPAAVKLYESKIFC